MCELGIDMKPEIQIDGERGRGASSRGTQVYYALINRVRQGDLKPGMRLREDELAKSLGVSRTPVREALGRLQSRGLVENVQGGLAIVELSRERIFEIYALRAVLEGAAARFAAQNASPADQAMLAHTAKKFSAYAGEIAGYAEMNTIFHEAIYAAAHNIYLTRMLDDLNDTLALLPKTTFEVSGRSEEAKHEHDAVLAAILAGNADAAEKAAWLHIDMAMKARLELLF